MLIETRKGEILKLRLSILKITPQKVEKGPWAVLGHTSIIKHVEWYLKLRLTNMIVLVITVTSSSHFSPFTWGLRVRKLFFQIAKTVQTVRLSTLAHSKNSNPMKD